MSPTSCQTAPPRTGVVGHYKRSCPAYQRRKRLISSGQCLQRVDLENEWRRLVMQCRRDERHAPVEHRAGLRGRPNRRLRRRVYDLRMMGRPLALDIRIRSKWRSGQRTEHLDFVGPGSRYTHRLGHRVSALCRHVNLSAVAPMPDNDLNQLHKNFRRSGPD